MIVEIGRRNKYTKIFKSYPLGSDFDDEGKSVYLGMTKNGTVEVYGFNFDAWDMEKVKSWVEEKGYKKFSIKADKSIEAAEVKQMWMEKIGLVENQGDVVKITGAFYPYVTDRDGDIIDTETLLRSWEREYKYNPIVLYMHNRWDTDMPGGGNPIGKVVKVWTVDEWMGKKFEQPVLLGEIDINDGAVIELINNDKVRALSIGFIANEVQTIEIGNKKVIKYTDIDWLETSVVDIPSNRYAIFEVNKMLKEFKESMEKTVPANPSSGLNDSDEWSFNADEGNAVLEKGGWKLYAGCHAWYDGSMEVGDSGFPEVKSAYKLPHHKIDVDGNVKVFWSGVSAAMGALLGARGGADIPADEREKVYSHLVGHYDQFKKEPPQFKEEEVKEVDEMVEEVKEEVKEDAGGIDKVLQQIGELSKISDEFTKILVEKDVKIHSLEEKIKEFEKEIEKSKVSEEKDDEKAELMEKVQQMEQKLKDKEMKEQIEEEVSNRVEQKLKSIIDGLSGTKKTIIREDEMSDGDKKAIDFLNNKIRR